MCVLICIYVTCLYINIRKSKIDGIISVQFDFFFFFFSFGSVLIAYFDFKRTLLTFPAHEEMAGKKESSIKLAFHNACFYTTQTIRYS